MNIFFILQTFGFFFFPDRTWLAPTNLLVNLISSAVCLAGIPVILLAAWGVAAKVEAFLRLYLYYMILTFGTEFFFAVINFLTSGPCQGALSSMMSGESSSRTGNNAFACGVARLGGSSILVTNFGIAAYFIFLLWSYCEDLANGGGPDLADLAAAKDMHAWDPVKMAHSINSMSNYGAALNFGGANADASTIFGGQHHETRFPPP
eukprot:CAMPEP_0172710966 /NCGR_PEP_ID=MMETSP1074-20121228/57497_1 /TAXON_ID=2916 /ORGANISM="Ceratium fusus, Strain PA161109" /LENGTH=205 /DNA_ID=CAMNT_0013534505 /DNA_START=184 /DNA_END=801 /DNA_ORIENTATION=+